MRLMTSSFLEWLPPANFMPHGHCYLWPPDVLWLHVGSDTLIAASAQAPVAEEAASPTVLFPGLPPAASAAGAPALCLASAEECSMPPKRS